MLVRFLPKILDAELGFDVGMIPAPDLGAALGFDVFQCFCPRFLYSLNCTLLVNLMEFQLCCRNEMDDSNDRFVRRMRVLGIVSAS